LLCVRAFESGADRAQFGFPPNSCHRFQALVQPRRADAWAQPVTDDRPLPMS
jgi:hypothetical protein